MTMMKATRRSLLSALSVLPFFPRRAAALEPADQVAVQMNSLDFTGDYCDIIEPHLRINRINGQKFDFMWYFERGDRVYAHAWPDINAIFVRRERYQKSEKFSENDYVFIEFAWSFQRESLNTILMRIEEDRLTYPLAMARVHGPEILKPRWLPRETVSC